MLNVMAALPNIGGALCSMPQSLPNLMVALPNVGGALCSTQQTLADAHYYAVQ